MQVVATKTNYKKLLSELSNQKYIGLDTETTGLNPFKNDRIFAVPISTLENDYYFNFHKGPDYQGNLCPEETILPPIVLQEITTAVNTTTGFIFIQNAKFDLKMFYVDYCLIDTSKVFCTQSLFRLINNQLMNYSLKALGKIIGSNKDDGVELCITKNKLYEVKGKGKKDKKYFLVPFDIMTKYAMQDSRIHLELGLYILKEKTRINKIALDHGRETLEKLFIQEQKLTGVLFKMEVQGIKVDENYINKARRHENSEYFGACEQFQALTGIEFNDGKTTLLSAFEKLNLSYKKTAKGNPSFSKDNLPDNSLGRLISKIRKHFKLVGTYYNNFLELKDKNNIIHCNFKQGGTSTGRMSCSDPNLQNIPKRGEEKNKYKVRQCFIPREGYFFAMIDFDQMEYRLLLDWAREDKVIDKILNEGLDVHTATAQEMNASRDHAKTLNFMLLYGGGVQKLADALSIKKSEAQEKKNHYFSSLKLVSRIVKRIISSGEKNGFIITPFGRHLKLTKKELAYQLPNHVIQGS